MKNLMKEKILRIVAVLACAALFSCGEGGKKGDADAMEEEEGGPDIVAEDAAPGDDVLEAEADPVDDEAAPEVVEDAAEEEARECTGADDCDDGHACTVDSCDPVSHACLNDAAAAEGIECRATAGPCDVAEECDGIAEDCPADAFEPGTTVCRPAAGDCDVAESCMGTSAACPADVLKGADFVCRPAVRGCDAAERCDGINPACPADGALIPPDGWACIFAGTFTMGSPEGELGRESDETQHEVTLTIDFAMMKYEVTQGEFSDLMGYNPSGFTSCGTSCPVEMLGWHEAAACANALSLRDGLTECFDCTGAAPDFTCALKGAYAKPQDCPGYRLPTEAEWEYAARAGTTTAFYNGGITYPICDPLDANLDLIGWYCGNAGGTAHVVGGKQANAYGLFDMSGNVWEWVWDWYGNYSGAATDPWGPASGSFRVNRGGSWGYDAQYCRSAYRWRLVPDSRDSNHGFRLARSMFP